MSLQDTPLGGRRTANRYDSPFLDEQSFAPEGETEWRPPEPASEGESPFTPTDEREQEGLEAFNSEGGFGLTQEGPPSTVSSFQGDGESGARPSETGVGYEGESPFAYNEAEWEETLAGSSDEAAAESEGPWAESDSGGAAAHEQGAGSADMEAEAFVGPDLGQEFEPSAEADEVASAEESEAESEAGAEGFASSDSEAAPTFEAEWAPTGEAVPETLESDGELPEAEEEFDAEAGLLAAPPDSWVVSATVRAAGESQTVPYDGAPKWDPAKPGCSGSLSPGAQELRRYLRANFRGISAIGGYNCRPNSASSGTMSMHGTGRALDIMIRPVGGKADAAAGDPIAGWLVLSASALGVQYLIWNRVQWSGRRSQFAAYRGPNPHVDHIHVELTRAGARRETAWFKNRAARGTPALAPVARLAEREHEAAAAPAAVDADAAVPVFSAAVQKRVCRPFLLASQVKTAVTWNSATHPSKTGVSLADLEGRVKRYIDTGALRKALDDFNAANPSLAVPVTADAMRVHAVHQFQCKVFADTTQRDGQAGEATLDVLGFVVRAKRKLESVDTVNTTAKRTLVAEKTMVRAAAAIAGLTENTWFNFMVKPPYLGQMFKNGIHLELLYRLRVVERHLMSLPQYADRTPVELGFDLDVDEFHRGARPTATSHSMHTFGLAADIGYYGNPWVGGNPDAPTGNSAFRSVSKRASLLLTGTETEVDAAYLHGLGSSTSRSTAEIYAELKTRSNQFRRYLALDYDAPALQSLIQGHHAKGTGGIFTAGQTVAQAVATWQTQIGKDLASMRTYFGNERNPLRGYLNLHPDFVIALRERGCLAWGAIDFGSTSSGDVMHFDTRTHQPGKSLCAAGSGFVPAGGHPCDNGMKSAARVQGPLPPPMWGKSRSAEGETLWLQAVLGAEGETRPVTALFIPTGFKPGKEVDVVLYLPGHKVRDHKPADSIIEYLAHRKSGKDLRKEVFDSNRNVLFVAPTLGPKSEVTRYEGAKQGMWLPGQVDLFFYRIFSTLRHQTTFGRLALRNLIVAGHSGGGHAMLRLLEEKSEVAEHVREVWGFDIMYQSAEAWNPWVKSRPQVPVFLYYEDTKTQSKALDAKGHAHVTVTAASDHDRIPPKHLKERLTASAQIFVTAESEWEDLVGVFYGAPPPSPGIRSD